MVSVLLSRQYTHTVCSGMIHAVVKVLIALNNNQALGLNITKRLHTSSA